MSRINDLIKQHCPNGVEFRELGKACKIKTGATVSKQLIVSNPGNYPVINSGRKPLGFIDQWNTENDPIGITSRGAGVGSITWCEGTYYRGNLNYSCTIVDKKNLSIRYLFHLLNNMQMKIQSLCTYDGIPALNKANLEKLEIPLPHPEIQQEIVDILDKFTKLEEELEAELEARQQQYSHYLDELLSFNEGDNVPLNTLLNYAQPTKYIVNSTEYDEKFSTPVLTAGDGFILGYTNETKGIYNASKGTPVIIFDDFTTSFHWVNFKFKVKSSAMKMITPKDGVNFKYVYYAMKNIQYTPSSHARHWISKYSNFEVPLPHPEVQQEIVAILDRFDALVNDISSGLPAEITARRQQYEHYRHKLLTFKEVV